MGQWTTLLEPAAAERAWQVIDHIAGALRDPPPPYDGALTDEGLRASLIAREPGFAVFYSYLAMARGDDQELREVAADHLAAGLEHVGEIAARRPGLFIGFTGTAWALEHLGRYLDLEDEEALTGIDRALAGLVDALPADYFHPLDRGFCGFAVYALERLPRRSARECLELVCQRLIAAAEEGQPGLRWRMRGSWMIAPDGQPPPDQFYTGVATGAAGPIAVLANALRAGVARGRAEAAVAAGIEWLLAQRRARGGATSLPPRQGVTGEAASWSDGPVAVAAALAGSQAAADPDRARAILDLARAAAGRRREVADASLTAGAAGVAHSFNRLFQATGEELFARAARAWFAVALDMFDRDGGFGGYRFHSPEWENRYIPGLPTGMIDLPGIGVGVAGVGLALLAAASPIEPAWDRMLLLSSRTGE